MRKILIDFRRYFDNTGLSSYLRMILQAISTDTSEYYILVNIEDEVKMKKEICSTNIKILKAISRPFSFNSNFEIPLIIKKNNITLFHSIHFDIPLFICFTKCHLISTIHDIIPLKYSKFYETNFIKRIYFEIMYRACVFLSNKILTVSNYTKQDLIEYLKVPRKKITVVYNSFQSKRKTFSQGKKDINKYKILFVGTNFKHKNILPVVKAIKILKEKNINVHFDIAGAKREYTNILEDYIKNNSLEKNVTIWGKVSNEQLDKLYNNANCYVFPSLVEGFGIPILEAMNYGLPVISSNKTVMPEVISNAGILIEPTAENFANKIEYLIKNPVVSQEFVNKGYERIKYFSQEKFNTAFLKAYKTNEEPN